MESILEADGASLADVVKVTAHLSDISLFSRYNTTYAGIFQKPYPVRTTVESGFADPKMLIELDCVAYAPKSAAKKAPRRSRAQENEEAITVAAPCSRVRFPERGLFRSI